MYFSKKFTQTYDYESRWAGMCHNTVSPGVISHSLCAPWALPVPLLHGISTLRSRHLVNVSAFLHWTILFTGTKHICRKKGRRFKRMKKKERRKGGQVSDRHRKHHTTKGTGWTRKAKWRKGALVRHRGNSEMGWKEAKRPKHKQSTPILLNGRQDTWLRVWGIWSASWLSLIYHFLSLLFPFMFSIHSDIW